MPSIRLASIKDALRISELLRQLGYEVTPSFVEEKLTVLSVSPMDQVLVAESKSDIVGVMSLHVLELFHANRRLGRITSLVVDAKHRHLGILRAPAAGRDPAAPAPNLSEQRKMSPLLEGFAKAMIICAAGDGELAPAELEWIVGFTANSGGTYEVLQELGSLDPKALDTMQLLAQTERPGLFVHSLVYNAICASDADGVLEPGEVQTIHAMAMVLGLPESEVDGLFALQREEKALRERKLALLFPNGHPWG